MKPISRIIPVLFAVVTLAHSQEQVSPAGTIPVTDPAVIIATGNEAQITGGISDGTPSPPLPEPEPIPFVVKNTFTKRVHVVESPEMPDVPAPEGDINVIVQLVKDPGLVDPTPPPLPALPPDDPAVSARIAELAAKYQDTQLVFVSATVFNHSRTLLHLYPSGKGQKEITAWSNLDFNNFSGFGTYQVTGSDGETREYGLLMGIGNEDTVQLTAWLATHDVAYKIPEIPALPDLASSGPAFVVVDSDTNDVETMQLIQGMHDLYRAEGPRMVAAYQARIKAYDARKAYLLANPPKPKDISVQFWKRETPSLVGVQSLKEGVRP